MIKWIAQEFDCFEGPPKAYFSWPLSESLNKNFVYRRIGLRTRMQENAEKRLVEALMPDFYALSRLPITKTLIWRTKPEFWSDQTQVIGKCVLTAEQEKDGRTIPLGAKRSWFSQNWYDSVEEITEYGIFMRLCIPALEFTPYTFQFDKQPGAEAKLI